MGSMILFTYLKIIMLQCFSVSVFNFQLYPNEPLVFFFPSPIMRKKKVLWIILMYEIQEKNKSKIISFFGLLTENT